MRGCVPPSVRPWVCNLGGQKQRRRTDAMYPTLFNREPRPSVRPKSDLQYQKSLGYTEHEREIV